MARAHALAEGISISKAVNVLLRMRRQGGLAAAAKHHSPGVHPVSGFPVSRSGGGSRVPEDAAAALESEDDARAYGKSR